MHGNGALLDALVFILTAIKSSGILMAAAELPSIFVSAVMLSLKGERQIPDYNSA